MSGVRVVRHSDIPEFVAALFPAELAGLWDLAVYKGNDQCVSAVLGRKTATDGRRLVPLDVGFDAACDEALLRYVVQHTEPAWPAMEVPPPPDEAADAADAEAAPAGRAESASSEVGDATLHALVGMLGDGTASTYETWRNVGIVLKSAGGGGDRHLGLYHEFSRKSTTKYEGPARVAAMWKSLCRAPRGGDFPGASNGPTRRLLTEGTLRRYARRDSPAAYEVWRRESASSEAAGESPAEGAMEGARRLLDAMGLGGGAVGEIEAPTTVEGATVSFGAVHCESGLRCVVLLGLKDLRAVVTLEGGAVLQDAHLNKEVGLAVGRDLCRVHAAIPADQT